LFVLVLGEGLYQSENLAIFLLILAGDFLATLALYIPYSLLPETAIAQGISQVCHVVVCMAQGPVRQVEDPVLDSGRCVPDTCQLCGTQFAVC
jgi:hypothetical protein